MKGTYLGEFQEVVLLTILVLDDNAYGVSIQEEIERRTQRSVSRGALHTALTRLEEKGFINSEYGGATAERGGRRKRFYHLTNLGKKSLDEAKSLREELWNSIPEVALNKLS